MASRKEGYTQAATAARSGDRGNELVMPARREWDARVKFTEVVSCDAGKIGSSALYSSRHVSAVAFMEIHRRLGQCKGSLPRLLQNPTAVQIFPAFAGEDEVWGVRPQP
jgi:hypothetical protein